MNFKEAWELMRQGAAVKLPSWGGYWCLDEKGETIMMHTKDGEVLDIRQTDRPLYTFGNIASDEWQIADENNCPQLGGEATFSFGEAIKYLKRGMMVSRKGWNGKGMYLKLLLPNDEISDGYPLQACIAMKTANCQIQPGWVASQADMLAEDWVFAE